MYYNVLKRCVDLFVSITALIVLLPWLIVTSVGVWAKLGAPVFFRQLRPGKHGKTFVMYKFRTMSDQRDQDGKLLPDEKRLNPFGAFLRSTSLDELPELFNVVLGQMSLVGPRPLKLEYLERYSPEQSRRHNVKPGITGWAQVNGRNALTWEERFDLDLWYVEKKNFWLDLKILLKTAHVVLRREGISAKGHATMPDFVGTRPSEMESR